MARPAAGLGAVTAGAKPDADRILAGLDEQQRLAATTLGGPVAILAGAGTGKTRAITHRIAYAVATGDQVEHASLALTFTSRAAGEMRTRLARLGAGGVQARTFHAAALAQLSHFWPRITGSRMPQLLPQKAKLLADAAAQLRLRLPTAQLRDAAGEIEWRKSQAMTMEDYGLQARIRSMPTGVDAETMIDLHMAYERVKDERRQIDFEDVLLATTGMLEREPVVADEVRSRYRHFTVDEYQDVSPMQQQLLAAWLGDRRDVCVVGDPSQTIYSFAGADPASLSRFVHDHPDAEVVRLERSYRSTAAIVGCANRLMRGRDALTLTAASWEHGLEPAVAVHGNDTAEAAAIAAACRAQVDAGADPGSIAVLTRFHAQSGLIEQALAGVGLSSTVRGSVRFFELPVIKRAVMMLRSAPADGRPVFQAVTDIVMGLGYRAEPPATHGEERSQWDALHALVTLAEEAGGTDLPAFAADLQRRAQTEHEPTVAAVTIATIHAAKGLEWQHVHVCGLAEGLLPISHATTLAEIDEERRLLYVAITRAQRSLSLTWAQHSGHAVRQPSRFLAELRAGRPAAAGGAAR
ncbi:ATP-dependent helicase [Agrococcus sp. BE272]|uniref:ATP-dependent helicase n=1 Tax=Agrococcus sp. BE272 TaxID=2817727 RepID=UPI0028626198|nr:ATP-dependent helicase [Agrococcus sp. BE272]MDR7234257.1 DNA helicase-2/ATP-dependent DNA helicase PcrA [Agrococcus sp. BE272]